MMAKTPLELINRRLGIADPAKVAAKIDAARANGEAMSIETVSRKPAEWVAYCIDAIRSLADSYEGGNDELFRELKDAMAARDAEIAAEAAAREREVVAQWMIANTFVTGHGDTTADLLDELLMQVRPSRKPQP